jgi:putative ABC transport system ATP-binding protein
VSGAPAGGAAGTADPGVRVPHPVSPGGADGSDATPLIDLRGVGRSYRLPGGEIEALIGVDVRIERGELVALVGESGAGTSSLLNILALLDVPTAGRYRFNGFDVAARSRRELARLRATRIGIVSPSFDLLPGVSVLDNLELPMLYAHSEQRRRRARQALSRVGMAELGQRLPGRLLPAQRYRVQIARALVNDPVLLLRDKPTIELDPEVAADATRLLEQLRRSGHTVVFCGAGEQQVRFAARVITLHEGRVISDCPGTDAPAPAPPARGDRDDQAGGTPGSGAGTTS